MSESSESIAPNSNLYKWVDVLKQCRLCNATGLWRGAKCGKCNGHGNYYVARLAQLERGTEG